MKTKEAFHKLIDKIEDEKLLKGYFELFKRLNANESGKLWNSLNSEEKDDLMLSLEESHDSKNLVPHQKVKQQHSQWLKG